MYRWEIFSDNAFHGIWQSQQYIIIPDVNIGIAVVWNTLSTDVITYQFTRSQIPKEISLDATAWDHPPRC